MSETMYTGITTSNLDAIAYHLEQGIDNGGVAREPLALFLRSTARGIESAEASATELAEQLATAQAQLAKVTELLEDFKLLHGVARRERDALQAQLDEIGEEDFE